MRVPLPIYQVQSTEHDSKPIYLSGTVQYIRVNLSIYWYSIVHENTPIYLSGTVHKSTTIYLSGTV